MTNVMTSDSHPIEVGWLKGPWAGRMGLTIAPGKKHPSALGSGSWDRDLATDLDRLIAHHGMQSLVCLLESDEMKWLGIPNLLEEVQARSVRVLHHAITDVSVPQEHLAFREAVMTAVAEVEAGSTVIVHCRGGLGRSGVFGGCALVHAGLKPDEALAALREARGPSCPETEAQYRYVKEFANAR